jgi:hypothetical protein
MGRRGSSGGVKQKKRKKVLVTPADKMKDGKPTEPYRILQELIGKYRSDLDDAEIVILWRAGWRSDADGWTQMVNVKKAGDVDRALSVKADFAVMLNKELFPRLPERMKAIYLHHALEHMQPLIDTDGEQKQDDKGRKLWRVKKRHDVEQFSEIVKEYGEESLNLDQDAIATIKDADRPLLAQPEQPNQEQGQPSPAAPPAAWRDWGLQQLENHGLPAGKRKLLEQAGLDTMGKLVDKMNKLGGEDLWWKDVKGFGESGYNALVDAMMSMRKALPEFQAEGNE